MVREGVGVVDRLGIRLPSDPFGEVLRVAEATRDNYSSMLQDILNRRKTEVDYINGAIVLRGREVGVDAPVNYTLWLLVRALEDALISGISVLARDECRSGSPGRLLKPPAGAW
ncbi:ketopantoate reductase family protein [Vulcanisaeta sp. JCM 14467]|uniref:ketopantoate reductase family protein n=1 Tax=Vulcanisaeta sp. JCM 14467 TaxID=1295370 RepID=UPI0006CF3A2A|nr:ketopantoate reductase C-terminal domain-containing protein [Vulcanisaeta sp. JCM 14467]